MTQTFGNWPIHSYLMSFHHISEGFKLLVHLLNGVGVGDS